MTPTPIVGLLDRLRRVAPEPLVSHYSSLRLLRDRDLLLLAVANLLDRMSISLVVPLLPTYADQLGASTLLVGAIFAAETAANALLSTPFGFLSDRYDRRWLVAGGLAVSALSVVALGLVRAPLLFVALRGVDGAATAMRSPATSAYVGDRFDESERGSAMGAYRTLGTLGVAVGPALGGLLASVGGLALPFVVLGSGTLLGGVLVFVFLESIGDTDGQPSGGSDDRRSEESDGGTDGNPGRSLRAWSIRRAARVATVPMVAVGLSVFVAQLGTGAFGPMFAVLIEENLAAGPAYTGALWGLFGLSMFVFMPVGGTLADRAGRKRSLVAGKLLWAVVVVGLALASTRLLPPLLVVLAGIASAFAGPALVAIQYEVAPDGHEGAFLGFYATLASAGMTVGPLVGGAIVDRWGVTVLFLAMGALWFLDTGTVAFGIRETRADGRGDP